MLNPMLWLSAAAVFVILWGFAEGFRSLLGIQLRRVSPARVRSEPARMERPERVVLEDAA